MFLAKTNSRLHYFIFCSFMYLFFQNLKAQDRRILEGNVSVDSIQNVSGVHVINLNAETGATTNLNGDFKIPARPGDSIFFSSVQFAHTTVIVNSAYIKDGMKVKLREKFNELDEIQLDDIRLSGVLSEDITRMPKSVYEKLGIPFPKPRRSSLQLAIQSAKQGGPLITIMNTLNGKIKQLEKAEENNKKSIMVNKGLNLVGEMFFISQLKIPEVEIINFLFYCADNPEFSDLVSTESVLKLVEFYKKQAESFKELRELD